MFDTVALLCGSAQQRQRRFALLANLGGFAVLRPLFRSPAQELRAMAEAVSRKMIVLHFDDQLRRDWFPFARTLCTPAARATRRSSGKSRRFDKRFQALR